MALIDFGMKARRERDEARRELARVGSDRDVAEMFADGFEASSRKYHAALREIANSTAKAGSAVRLANIARKALGRPVGGGDE